MCPSCLLEWGLGAPENDDSPAVTVEGTGEQQAASPLPARLAYFGDYELLEEIARGGMGVVYKARQVSLNRIVAVKMILAGQFAGRGATQRFKTEAEAAAHLRHPGIVGVHEVGQHEGFHYFSMDYIEGKNLTEIVRAKPVSPQQAAEWVRAVAQAIHYAHEQGILHRDIKPSNILIDALNVPHVTDFGLAKQVQAHSEITVSGEVLGSPNYMPPEQAGGHLSEVGRASDVYSLGAVLYHLLAGRPPFVGQTMADTVDQVIHQDAIAPRLLNASAPPDLETICLKCLEKEPRRRYQSAQELADELGRFLRDEPILARPAGATEKAWRWCRRKPVVAALTASLVLVSLLGLAGVLTQLRRVQAKSEEHRRELAQLRVLNGVQLMQAGDYFKSLLWFADALEIDEAIPARQEIHQMRIAAVLAQCPRLVQVISHDGRPIASAAFSPTDDRLATIGADRTARVWEIPSGKPLMKTKPLPALPIALSFSPDGARLLIVLLDNTARLLDPATGAQLIEPLPHHFEGADNSAFAPVFDPSGKKLMTQPKEKELQIWDVVTGKPIGARMVHTNLPGRAQFSADGTRLLTCDTHDFGYLAWDADTGKPAPFPVSGPEALKTFYFSPQANVALIGGRIWKWTGDPSGLGVPAAARSGSSLQTTPIGEPLVDPTLLMWATFSPHGDRLLTASRDRTARIWDTATGKPLTLPLPHDQVVRRGEFSPDGRRVATVSEDNLTRVWDADTGQPLTPAISHAAYADVSAFSGSGRYLLTVHPEFLACVWDLHQERAPPVLLKPLSGAPAEVAARGGVILARAANNLIRVQSMAGALNVPLHPMSLKTVPRQMWFDATSRFVIVEGEMAKVQVWEAASGTPITPLVPSRYTLDENEFNNVKLPLAGLPPADATELAQLLSGSRLDGSGGWISLKFEELAPAWERLSGKYHGLFRDSAVDGLAWHRLEAEAAQGARDWPSALFHWQRLRAAQPANLEFAERHEYALKCQAKAAESAPSYRERRRAIPPQDPQAGGRLIDLTDYYTWPANFTDYYTDPVMAGVRVGLQTLAGVRFDVRGAVTLFGCDAESYGIHGPEQVTGIKVQQRCKRMHLLHTARWASGIEGEAMAVLVVKYANGQVEKITIQDLVQIAHDWSDSSSAPKQAQVAWVGADPLANSRQYCVRLFKYTWPNPHPDWEISQIDLVSTKSHASYVLVAITLE
jgi:WD40 repeat protein/predicted Ser/Thr protein kinase